MIGLETSVGLVMKFLVTEGHLSLVDIVEKMAINPRRILKLPVPEIKEGEKANISILDQNLEWKVDKSTFKSNSRNTPFDNWTLIGKAFGVYNHGIWCCEM